MDSVIHCKWHNENRLSLFRFARAPSQRSPLTTRAGALAPCPLEWPAGRVKVHDGAPEPLEASIGRLSGEVGHIEHFHLCEERNE